MNEHHQSPPEDAAEGASPAVVRFRSCRWRVLEDEGISAHCSHRDVLPFAGTSGFNPEAWCPDCEFYKLRRTPKKHRPQPDLY
jgi:hypothetical protein